MSTQPGNDTYKKQQHTLVRSTFKKGVINAVYASSRTVDVSYAENPLTVVRNIPVALNVTMSTLLASQRCRVDIFDETNPSDCVMAYAY